MSRIDELIREMCPDGVRFLPLWELTAWDKKFNAVENFKQASTIRYKYLLASELRALEVPNGDVKMLTTHTSEIYTSQELAGDYLAEGEVIAIPWGGNANVQYHSGKFVTADNRLAQVLNPQVLNTKFLFRFLENNLALLETFYRGSGIKHPSMAKVLDLRIPVPPMAVQEEIVRILDTFTELEAELEAELEMRSQQLDTLRQRFLDFGQEGVTNHPLAKSILQLCPQGVDRFTLPEVALVSRGLTYKKSDEDPEGPIRVLRSNNIDAASNRLILDDSKTLKGSVPTSKKHYLRAGDILMSGSSGSAKHVGKVAFVREDLDYVFGGFMIAIRAKEVISPRFLYFVLTSNQFRDYLDATLSSTTINNINQEVLNGFSVPLPPLPIQEETILILESMEALRSDLRSGLPAEIFARRKQYEYYRDKLLTFEELVA